MSDYLNCFDCKEAHVMPRGDYWQLYCCKSGLFCGYNDEEVYGCKNGVPQQTKFIKKPDFTRHTGQGDYTN